LQRERERERESSAGLFHSYDSIISVENLLESWREFARDKKKQEEVIAFSVRLMDNILALRRELVSKTYRHGFYRPAKIADPKPRDIHIANVRDRLVHHAIYRVLYRHIDRQFIWDSYSCRSKKGTHRAFNRFREYARDVSYNHSRTVWVLKCDIRKFFANIDHTILLFMLAEYISDADTLNLLKNIVDSFSSLAKPDGRRVLLNESGGEDRVVGLPLGNLTSQLLVNVYMNEFDRFVKQELRIRHYVRYADDFVILHGSRSYLLELLPKLSEFLEKRLKLSLHPDKVFIKTLASGVDFLGWVHFPHHRVLRTSTKKRMFRRLVGNLKEETIVSYLGLLSHGNAHKLSTRIVKMTSI